MGNQNSDFRPLEPERAKDLEFIINKATRDKEAIVIDPDSGVSGTKPVNLLSPNSKTNALVRYGRHYL